ncbi:hypothetical protein ACNZ61_002130 [Enterococcus hirae]
MIAMIIGAAYIAYEKKLSKAVPLVIVFLVAVWLVGDTTGVFNWLLQRMQSWGK